MMTPSESQEKKVEKLVVIYAPPVMISHLFSLVDLGELLAAHSLEVAIVLGGRTDDMAAVGGAAAESFAHGLAAVHPKLSFHYLPYVTRPRDVPAHDYVVQTFELARASNSDLREFLRAASPSPAALVLDFFCGSAVDVGAELGIPTYFFFTSSIAGLAQLLYYPLIHGQTSQLLHTPGITPIPVDDLPPACQDRDSLGNRLFLALSEQMCNSHGLVVNSLRSLEPRATDAIVAGLCTPPGRRTPPLHCIGPVIKLEEVGAKGHECLAWLDAQPEASVVFLCFGSMGRFSAEQTRHVARGLEMSGQRFLWVVRRPPGGEGDGHVPQKPDDGLDALLPEGFLARTKDKGLVVEAWAPQREVLAHGAVGGFVTYCGWNSVLEATMGGVPMLAWPMYAEQRMNKVFLVEDEEVAAKVKWLMESDDGRELRERTRAAMREAKEALSDAGESTTALLELVRQWKM